jgi:CMP-N-acetylneuraminic acid synthetase
MPSTDDILGIITARGGSKRLPGKNLAILRGKPLLTYTCEAAKASQRLTRVILSTDDEAIARVGKECGIEVPFMRPPELATDNAQSIDVVLHVLDALHKREGYRPSLVVLLQPTSPLRTGADIDAAIALLLERGADSLVSVTKDGKRNGALYVIRPDVLERTGDFGGGTHVPFVMDCNRSIDIDEPFDLAQAEYLLRSQR